MTNIFRTILSMCCVSTLGACARELPPAASAYGATARARVGVCAPFSPAERASNLFDGAEVLHVAPYFESVTRIKSQWRELRGAQIAVRAAPGMTRQSLTLRARCQVADGASAYPGAQHSPLAAGPVDVAVREFSTGFTLFIRTQHPDKAQAQLILERSRGLVQATDDNEPR